jgi:hypothetical protein
MNCCRNNRDLKNDLTEFSSFKLILELSKSLSIPLIEEFGNATSFK